MTDLLRERYNRAIDKSHKNTEQVIKDLLPEDYKLEDLKWAQNTLVKGASTLYYKKEPIISLFPIKMVQEHKEDGSVIVKIERKYVTH